MKLIEIKLNNFRSFYGNNQIDFGPGNGRNVTVIHAENHTGKTNFVDAFRWVLYGKITGEQRDQIVNHLALAEKAVDEIGKASVIVIFEHDGKRYEVGRTIGEKNWTRTLHKKFLRN